MAHRRPPPQPVGEDDNLTGAELITQPAAVNQYNRLRDVARHYAVPYQEFAAGTAAKEA
ncbi:DUF6879 family protein [Streptomyces huasconensis]|uniref:DUF6879 family protein n=1 Tax=Streptomyces huasconensis TaxID=1854574 RepID=UPI0036FDFA31